MVTIVDALSPSSMKPARPARGAFAEQPHRVERGERVDRRKLVAVGNCHRRNPPHHLAGDVEDLPARREHRQLRAAPRQLVDEGRAFVEHVFAVVEHEQHRLVTDVIRRASRRGSRRRLRARRARRRADGRRSRPRPATRARRTRPRRDAGRRGSRRAASSAASSHNHPRPVSVTSRFSSSACAMSKSSCSRPMNVVSCAGRLLGDASRPRSGAKSSRRSA